MYAPQWLYVCGITKIMWLSLEWHERDDLQHLFLIGWSHVGGVGGLQDLRLTIKTKDVSGRICTQNHGNTQCQF